MAIYYNPRLSDLSGLSGLTRVGGDLAIVGNPAVCSLAPLGNVTEVRLNLVVDNMGCLQDLAGLQVSLGPSRCCCLAGSTCGSFRVNLVCMQRVFIGNWAVNTVCL